MPNLPLMPNRVTMDRANRVSCSMSLEAPVVQVPNMNCSAARPAVSTVIRASKSSREWSTCSSSSTCMV